MDTEDFILTAVMFGSFAGGFALGLVIIWMAGLAIQNLGEITKWTTWIT